MSPSYQSIICDIVSRYRRNAEIGSDDFPVKIKTFNIVGTANIINKPLNFPTNNAK